jgi:hypothetical protein
VTSQLYILLETILSTWLITLCSMHGVHPGILDKQELYVALFGHRDSSGVLQEISTCSDSQLSSRSKFKFKVLGSRDTKAM